MFVRLFRTGTLLVSLLLVAPSIPSYAGEAPAAQDKKAKKSKKVKKPRDPNKPKKTPEEKAAKKAERSQKKEAAKAGAGAQKQKSLGRCKYGPSTTKPGKCSCGPNDERRQKEPPMTCPKKGTKAERKAKKVDAAKAMANPEEKDKKKKAAKLDADKAKAEVKKNDNLINKVKNKIKKMKGPKGKGAPAGPAEAAPAEAAPPTSANFLNLPVQFATYTPSNEPIVMNAVYNQEGAGAATYFTAGAGASDVNSALKKLEKALADLEKARASAAKKAAKADQIYTAWDSGDVTALQGYYDEYYIIEVEYYEVVEESHNDFATFRSDPDFANDPDFIVVVTEYDEYYEESAPYDYDSFTTEDFATVEEDISVDVIEEEVIEAEVVEETIETEVDVEDELDAAEDAADAAEDAADAAEDAADAAEDAGGEGGE